MITFLKMFAEVSGVSQNFPSVLQLSNYRDDLFDSDEGAGEDLERVGSSQYINVTRILFSRMMIEVRAAPISATQDRSSVSTRYPKACDRKFEHLGFPSKKVQGRLKSSH